MSLNVAHLYAQSEADRYEMHTRHLNEQMVRVLRTIGYDVRFCRGAGQYLYDSDDNKYLDLLSGYGVFAIGRNHAALREALKSVLDADLPNLVQFDVSPLAGVLAKRLLEFVPYLDKVFFANSGTEASEAAIKFVCTNDANEIASKFAGKDVGIDVAASGLVDLDIDCPHAIPFIHEFLPATATIGRAEMAESHKLFQCSAEIKTVHFKDIIEGMTVHEEVAVWRLLVLADSRFEQRGVSQGREAHSQIFANVPQCFRADDSLA